METLLFTFYGTAQTKSGFTTEIIFEAIATTYTEADEKLTERFTDCIIKIEKCIIEPLNK